MLFMFRIYNLKITPNKPAKAPDFDFSGGEKKAKMTYFHR